MFAPHLREGLEPEHARFPDSIVYSVQERGLRKCSREQILSYRNKSDNHRWIAASAYGQAREPDPDLYRNYKSIGAAILESYY